MNTPGFAIEIMPDTYLSTAVLTVEGEEYYYEVVGVVCTIEEAEAMAAEDMRERERALMADEYPGICPWEYKVWARGLRGKMAVAKTWNASEVLS